MISVGRSLGTRRNFKKLQTVNTPHEKDTIQRQIDATESQIDLLVYELYELTAEEEIRIVEGEE
jgi:hypothetical protein